MLVGAGEEPGLDAQRPLAPRNGVADDGRVGVAQVRPRIHVVDGRGQVIAGWAGCRIGHRQDIAFDSLVAAGEFSEQSTFNLRLPRGERQTADAQRHSVRIALENQGFLRHIDVYLELQKRLDGASSRSSEGKVRSSRSRPFRWRFRRICSLASWPRPSPSSWRASCARRPRSSRRRSWPRWAISMAFPAFEVAGAGLYQCAAGPRRRRAA